MIPQDPILLAVTAINTETIRAFDWLTGGIDRSVPVTFVPNPGNIGDAAINLACFDYLTKRFDTVEICAIDGNPHTECVFVGGGGNAVEPLYVNVRDFLDGLAPGHRLFMFPATIRGYSGSLQRVAPFTRILCREPISFAYVAQQIGPENVSLAHDAAFLLASRLRNDFASRIGKSKTAKCCSFRTDNESIHSELGGNDIMWEYQAAWTNMAVAHEFVWAAARYLLGFDEVETDRMHCAILAAILGRRTILRANSYYKNTAVFDHSLSRLPNTVFLLPDAKAMRAPRRGIKNAELLLRSLRRRLLWLGFRAFRWLCPRAAQNLKDLSRGNTPSAPSRRNFVRSIGFLAVAALPTWMAGAPSTQDIIVVDGWVLANTDLR
jgi:exopolysaccharide biosynthesis predicted pyruvyltransferase EpsI